MPIFACGVAPQPSNSLESLSKGYRNPSHPDQFSYIDWWFFLLLLKPLLWLECCALKQSSSILVTKSINQRLCRNLSKMPGLSGLARVKEENLPMHSASSGSNCIWGGQAQTVSMIYLKLPFPSHTWGGLDYSLPQLNKTPAVFSLREAPSSGFQLPLAQRILGEERPRPPSLIFVPLLISHLSNRRT